MVRRTIIACVLFIPGLFVVVHPSCAQTPKVQNPGGKEDRRMPPTDPRAYVPETHEKSLKPKDKARLQPAPEFVEKYAEFLKLPGTGIFKLLDPEGMTVTTEQLAEEPFSHRYRGAGSYFSFVTLLHDADNQAQLKLRHNQFQVGTSEITRDLETEGQNSTPITVKMGKSLALLYSLGDVPLVGVLKEADATIELAKINIPSKPKDFDALITSAEKGIESGGKKFQSSVPARINGTYLMRSVIYKKSDTTVAFRVVGRDRDGNLHIIWMKIAGD